MLLEKFVNKLTDGSKSYDLIVCRGGDTIILECNSQKDADDLQFKLGVLLAKHTNEQAVLK